MCQCSQVRCLYEDTEFNGRAEREDCLGTYDTLSELRKRKRENICRAAEVKLRLIVMRTGTCGVISHRCRNKLNVAESGEGVQGAMTLIGGLGGVPPPSGGSGAEHLSEGFSVARRDTI